MSELGRICTATPGVVHPTEGHIVLCPPEADCIDAVVHREDGPTVWSTRGGVTADVWHAQRAPAAGSPGTYGPTPPRHPWAPLPPEPDAHARCKHCTQPRHQHEEKR